MINEAGNEKVVEKRAKAAVSVAQRRCGQQQELVYLLFVFHCSKKAECESIVETT
jgi:hypothetical protein